MTPKQPVSDVSFGIYFMAVLIVIASLVSAAITGLMQFHSALAYRQEAYVDPLTNTYLAWMKTSPGKYRYTFEEWKALYEAKLLPDQNPDKKK